MDALQQLLSDRTQVGKLSIEFGSAKEDRGWYFVEYTLPPAGTWFAILTLTIPGELDISRVAQAMESEARDWLDRYPVPVMVSAFGAAGDLVDLTGVRPCDHLIGLVGAGNKHELAWRLIKDDAAPNGPFSEADLLRIYYGFPGTRASSARRDAEFAKRAKLIRKGKLQITLWLFVWIVAIPLAWAVFQWAGPRWLATAVLLYCGFRATSQALRLFGVIGPSHREQQAQETQRKMEHYYYHCERNPDGFERLKLDNFDQDARAEIAAEAEAVRMESQASNKGINLTARR